SLERAAPSLGQRHGGPEGGRPAEARLPDAARRLEGAREELRGRALAVEGPGAPGGGEGRPPPRRGRRDREGEPLRGRPRLRAWRERPPGGPREAFALVVEEEGVGPGARRKALLDEARDHDVIEGQAARLHDGQDRHAVAPEPARRGRSRS